MAEVIQVSQAPNVDEARRGEFIRLGELLIRADYVKLLRAHGLTTLDDLFAYDGGESLAKPGLARWRERVRVPLKRRSGEVVTLFLKRYTRPPGSEQRDQRWTCPRAASTAGLEWHWMLELSDAGIACVQPVAFGEQVENEHEIRSAVMAEAVPGVSLERWVQCQDRVEEQSLRHLAIHLARLVARLHRKGFVHRDLYLSHVFYDADAPLERSLRLIDVQRVMQPRWRHLRWIIKDLAALNYSTPAPLVSDTDRLRWLKRYLSVSRLNIDPKKLARRVLAKTRRIARHDRHRLARLQAGSASR